MANEPSLCKTQPLRFMINNLTRDKRVALKRLRSIDDLVINPADKVSSVVLMKTAGYITEPLSNFMKSITIKLDHDQTDSLNAEFN